MISQIISHYRIIDKLGESRLATACLAEDIRLGRRVTLIFLPSSFQYDPNRNRKLIKEASAAAALRSPHTVRIYDIGEHEGSIFIVRENVAGDLLSKRLERGRFLRAKR